MQNQPAALEILNNTKHLSLIRGTAYMSQPQNDTGMELFRCIRRSFGFIEPAIESGDDAPLIRYAILLLIVCLLLIVIGIVLYCATKKGKKKGEPVNFSGEQAKKSAEQQKKLSSPEGSPTKEETKQKPSAESIGSKEAIKGGGSREMPLGSKETVGVTGSKEFGSRGKAGRVEHLATPPATPLDDR
ncbi:hypothetical protein TELCIR_01007 [Teladorsagia circumcincta]|uniref:Uncharacterized protein n=1 Tax=Teladorsagia circumcincta TaxID=45464 RepID=A0A2G9V361_TELCI|nr:hypothetical protein TELCIR_01007 [Teladorsagia circumcincta]